MVYAVRSYPFIHSFIHSFIHRMIEKFVSLYSNFFHASLTKAVQLESGGSSNMLPFSFSRDGINSVNKTLKSSETLEGLAGDHTFFIG